MIVQPGAAVGGAEVVAVGELVEAVRAEGVGGETASSLEPSPSFCMGAAVAVVVAAAFCANYYGAHCLHFFLLPCPWHCRLPLHCSHPGSQGYQAGMAHSISLPVLPQKVQMWGL